MSEQASATALGRLLAAQAERAVPAGLDLWPAVRAELTLRQRRAHDPRPAPARTASASERLASDGVPPRGWAALDLGRPAPRGWLRQALGFAGALVALAFVAGLLMAIFGGGRTPGSTSSPVGQGDDLIIAWNATGDGAFKLFSVGAAGGERQPRKLVPGPAAGDPAHESAAAVSPDGARVAYVSDRDGVPALYVMQPNPVKIADGPVDAASAPAWSPDGARIAYATTGDQSAIYTVNTDGADRRDLTATMRNLTGDMPATVARPLWSPDGARIAFLVIPPGAQQGRFQYWIMDANGANPRVAADVQAPLMLPSWSPDGQTLLLSNGGDLELAYVSNQMPRQLVTPEEVTLDPQWSPDGSQIVYVGGSRDAPSQSLVVINADGSNPRVIARSRGALASPAWSPDGAQLAYLSGPPNGDATPASGPWELRVVGADGAAGQRVLSNVDARTAPVWRSTPTPGAATPEMTPTSAVEPTAMSSAWDGTLYAFVNGDVAVIDAQTGAVVRTLGVTIGSQNPFLAVDAASGRIAVADFLRDGNNVQLGVLIYRAADGSLEREIPVPTLIRYQGPGAGIAFSHGGRYLYVYQYQTPPDGNGNNARYWIGVFDLDTGTALPDIPVSGCPYVARMVASEPTRLDLQCADYFQVFDPVAGKILDTYGPGSGDAAFFIRNDTLYDVTPDWTIRVQRVDANPQVLDGSAWGLPGQAAAGLPIGLDTRARFLAVPIATDANGPSAIAIVDLQAGAVARVIQTSAPFREIAFAPDGSAAFVTPVGSDGFVTGLIRVDLTTGQETRLLDGQVGGLTIATQP